MLYNLMVGSFLAMCLVFYGWLWYVGVSRKEWPVVVTGVVMTPCIIWLVANAPFK